MEAVPISGIAPRVTRVISVIEGTWVTGPIKPLLNSVVCCRSSIKGQHPVIQSLVTTIRYSTGTPRNAFVDAAEALAVPLNLIEERRAFDFSVVGKLAQLLQSEQPNIVESHGYKSHILVLLARRRMRISGAKPFAWIAFHHGYTTESARVCLYNQLDRLTLPRADRVVTVCQCFARHLRSRGVKAARTMVIHNALAPAPPATAEMIATLRKQIGIAEADGVVLTVGRLSPEKGHSTLISAFQLMLQRGGRHDLRLVLVGDGIERNRLARQAQPLGDRIIFAGYRSDVWPWFGMARAFALPSLSEGSPMALLEAMQAKVPIVATTAGGIPETVQDGVSALLVPPRQPEALAFNLLRLLNDSALSACLAEAAYRTVQRYTPTHYSAALRSLYRDLHPHSTFHL